ncbi:MAG: glutamate-5-semialdehyde dehydrogenase [Chitinispirillaceae bacterium]|jgi:glutamate-5-semialdehyde dehydrogenase|nr:glutamate-5-semialdehyde dehydrogenase [Chitinispirillaceae bacterium]
MVSDTTDKLITGIACKAKRAALALQNDSPLAIKNALRIMAELLSENSPALKRANSLDCAAARKKGLSPAMIDRLTLSDKAIASMIRGLREVAALSSPVGKAYERRTRPNRLIIEKIRVPIGVIGIIYESRPNVTVDAAAICLKSHNAVILRGGSEAIRSNVALVNLFRTALKKAGVPEDAIQLIPVVDRKAIESMLRQESFIDLVIPRGGEGLIRMVVEKSRIPVIKHYKGVCHVYVSAKADMRKALPIAVNAKVQRPGVCNAMETLLLDRKLSRANRVALANALLDNKVTLFGDPETKKLSPLIKRATASDWATEYLDLRLAVRTVKDIGQAIEHINTYGSRHTDSIITESKAEAERFIREVDSSSVMVNASTRFSDGAEYGLGCEIGISTDKLHSRGPMGIDDLTTYKWVVRGTGQIRN